MDESTSDDGIELIPGQGSRLNENGEDADMDGPKKKEGYNAESDGEDSNPETSADHSTTEYNTDEDIS